MHLDRQTVMREIRSFARDRMVLAGLVGVSLSVLLAAPIFAKSDTIKILSLGDSITQAEINRASYRYHLWKKLIDADITFDFVGSMQKQQDKYSKGIPPQPDYQGHRFDQDHEGHFGWQTSDIIHGRDPNNGTGSGSLSQWVQGYQFDIVLIHLGTNDLFYKKNRATIAADLRTIVNILRNDNPDVIILLAQLIPTSRSDEIAKALLGMNETIADMVQEMNTRVSPVFLVDQYAQFDIETDSYDGVHPNASGEEKIAQRWFDAIERAIQTDQ